MLEMEINKKNGLTELTFKFDNDLGIHCLRFNLEGLRDFTDEMDVIFWRLKEYLEELNKEAEEKAKSLCNHDWVVKKFKSQDDMGFLVESLKCINCNNILILEGKV